MIFFIRNHTREEAFLLVLAPYIRIYSHFTKVFLIWGSNSTAIRCLFLRTITAFLALLLHVIRPVGKRLFIKSVLLVLI